MLRVIYRQFNGFFFELERLLFLPSHLPLCFIPSFAKIKMWSLGLCNIISLWRVVTPLVFKLIFRGGYYRHNCKLTPNSILRMWAIGVINTHINVGVVVIDSNDCVVSANGAEDKNGQEGWMQNGCETLKIPALWLAVMSGSVTCRARAYNYIK